jgi:hypothetical protein
LSFQPEPLISSEVKEYVLGVGGRGCPANAKEGKSLPGMPVYVMQTFCCDMEEPE